VEQTKEVSCLRCQAIIAADEERAPSTFGTQQGFLHLGCVTVKRQRLEDSLEDDDEQDFELHMETNYI
jgi:hypothetical protein